MDARLGNGNSKVRILLADDHRIVLGGLRALLNNEPDFQVVGEASNGVEALELVRTLDPDVLVMDLMMPVMSGLEATARLYRSHARVAVVILSMHNDRSYVLEAMRIGARAYVLKDNTSDELVLAVREAFAGRIYLGSSIPLGAFDNSRGPVGSSTSDRLASLTLREREVFERAVRGMTNVEIASSLGISARTVETHCISLNRKLGVSNRNQLLHLAIQHGLVGARDLLP